MRLLLLEDDAILGDGLRDFLATDGHVVDWVRSLSEARLAIALPYDALIVDWQLPDGSGLDWVESLRRKRIQTPVLMITARDQLSDRIAGLDRGTDDYLVKPFAPEELAARLRVVQRRASGAGGPCLELGELRLDFNARAVFRLGQPVPLTAREWALLEALAQRPGRIVSKTDLENLMIGHQGTLSGNALEVYISSLRRKLGRKVIDTIRGMGYRVTP